MIPYPQIKYDNEGDIIVDEELHDILQNEFSLNPKEAKEIFSMYVPTDARYYHNQPTPETFVNTHLLSEVADYKEKYGVYSPYAYKSQKYKEFWKEQTRRCLEGYTINEGTVNELSITGYHYFFLNFKHLEVVKRINGRDRRVPGFAHFYSTHYHLFWAYEECIRQGKHLCILKPRGVGFSEVMSSIAVCNYTFFLENNFFFAYDIKKLLGDGVFTKVTDHLNYLNAETEGAFRRLRTVQDQKLAKKAARKLNDTTIKVTGGYIEGRVIDQEHKARGSRGMLIGFEEAGSFKNLVKAITVSRPSVEEGNKVYGTIVAWGTGGSEQEYVEGLESIFYAPDAHNFKIFKNNWDRYLLGQDCGFFVPAYATHTGYMDKDGNVDEVRAYLYHFKEREKIMRSARNADDIDNRIAEFPFCPQEALLKQTISLFNQKEVQNQINYILSNDKKLLSAWLNGSLSYDKFGKVQFKHNSKAKRLDEYPVDTNKSIEGCISVLEVPKKIDGVVPKNLYTIGVDNYALDQASAGPGSLGSCWVINTQTGFIAAEYTGKPARLYMFWENVMLLAEYYNTTIYFERRGGGQTAIDFFRDRKKLHLLEPTPEILQSNKAKHGGVNQSYGIVYTQDSYWNAIKYLSDWLEDVVTIKEENGETIYIKRIHYVYSLGLLREISRFNEEGNFDRIDGLKNTIIGLKNNTVLNKKVRKDNPWTEIFNTLNI